MGKKQHQKDKLYLTTTEWSTLYGGRRANQTLIDSTLSRARQFHFLRYDLCALSLQPFRTPYTTREGVVYDLEHILPFIRKHGVDPSSGRSITTKDLIKLHYHKDKDGHYQCPVLFKRFTENSHIVAIATTGNVFSHEAVEQLNLKHSNFRDLLNDELFTKKDIIHIQDPHNLDSRKVSTFHHILHKLRWDPDESADVADETEGDAGPSSSSSSKSLTKIRNINKLNTESRETFRELEKGTEELISERKKQSELFGWNRGDEDGDGPRQAKRSKVVDSINAATYSTGRVAAGLTSTVMPAETRMEVAALDDDLVRYRRVKKKGYVQLQTSHGNLNFELYCQDVPRTCENFILLAKRGYYTGTVFHRLIKNFMVQGGDPTGTGRGGESAWGEPFKDEFRAALSHVGRGLLSMANSGPDTNKSQFFITFRTCNHLDRKHTIFGKLVGGAETLTAIERIPTNPKDADRPLEEIRIRRVTVFQDPFAEVDEDIANERSQMNGGSGTKAAAAKAAADQSQQQQQKPVRSGVGAFIKLPSEPEISKTSGTSGAATTTSTTTMRNKKVTGRNHFADFSSW